MRGALARRGAGRDAAARGGWARRRDLAAGASTDAASVAAVHDVAAFAQAVGQRGFHLEGFGVRHRVEVRVQTRHEPLAAAPDDAGGLVAFLVVLEPLFRREAGHADIISRLPVALRV